MSDGTVERPTLAELADLEQSLEAVRAISEPDKRETEARALFWKVNAIKKAWPGGVNRHRLDALLGEAFAAILEAGEEALFDGERTAFLVTADPAGEA